MQSIRPRRFRPLFVSAFACALAVAAPTARGTADPLTPEQQALHVLDRLAYGPRPGDLARVEAMGIDRYIDRQLAPNTIPENPDLQRQLADLQTLGMSPVALFDRYEPHPILGKRPSPDEAKAIRRSARIVVQQAVKARLLRATESNRQLQQVMTEFWFNHFNIFVGKGLDRIWIGSFEEQAIRPHALGHFRDLLEATAKHPAMLFYLDNWQNTAPGSPGARGKEQGINENYAREVMELHTLGVDGGYTQADVIALAHIFTGWGLPRGLRLERASLDGGFYFDPRRHDYGTKVFLGRTIQGAGMAEGEEALDMLARSPATAKHLAFELAQYFVADQPDPALVDALAKRYLETDGDIREVLRTLFKSPQFWDPKTAGRKFKTPYQYVISSIRLADVPLVNVRPVAGALVQLGMPLYGYQTPDGYKNTRDAWLNPDAMTRRLSFATALGAGQARIDRPPPQENGALADLRGGPAMAATPVSASPPRPLDYNRLIRALGGHLSATTEAAIAAAPPQLRAALVLGSPEFMNR